MALKKKRITAVSDLGKILDEGGWKPVPKARTAELLDAIRRNAEQRRHGGPRPGAGRKPGKRAILRKSVTFYLRPETVQTLRRLAPSRKKVSATLEKIVEAAAAKAAR